MTMARARGLSRVDRSASPLALLGPSGLLGVASGSSRFWILGRGRDGAGRLRRLLLLLRRLLSFVCLIYTSTSARSRLPLEELPGHMFPGGTPSQSQSPTAHRGTA